MRMPIAGPHPGQAYSRCRPARRTAGARAPGTPLPGSAPVHDRRHKASCSRHRHRPAAGRTIWPDAIVDTRRHAHVLNDLPLPRNDIQRLGDRLAKFPQTLSSTAWAFGNPDTTTSMADQLSWRRPTCAEFRLCVLSDDQKCVKASRHQGTKVTHCYKSEIRRQLSMAPDSRLSWTRGRLLGRPGHSRRPYVHLLSLHPETRRTKSSRKIAVHFGRTALIFAMAYARLNLQLSLAPARMR